MINQVTYGKLKINFRNNTEDEKVLQDSFDNDIFYKELPYLRVSKQPIIVDVGAHIGTFSLYSVIKFPNARIYSFEASKETFSLLARNVNENGLGERIKHFNIALAGYDGTTKLYHNLIDGNWGHTITKNISPSYEDVTCLSFVTFLEKNNIPYIDLIKFNCEGAEFDILLKASEQDLQKIKCGVILYHLDLIALPEALTQLDVKLKRAGFYNKFLYQTKDRGWIITVNKKYYFPLLVKILLYTKRKYNNWRKRS